MFADEHKHRVCNTDVAATILCKRPAVTDLLGLSHASWQQALVWFYNYETDIGQYDKCCRIQ